MLSTISISYDYRKRENKLLLIIYSNEKHRKAEPGNVWHFSLINNLFLNHFK